MKLKIYIFLLMFLFSCGKDKSKTPQKDPSEICSPAFPSLASPIFETAEYKKGEFTTDVKVAFTADALRNLRESASNCGESRQELFLISPPLKSEISYTVNLTNAVLTDLTYWQELKEDLSYTYNFTNSKTNGEFAICVRSSSSASLSSILFCKTASKADDSAPSAPSELTLSGGEYGTGYVDLSFSPAIDLESKIIKYWTYILNEKRLAISPEKEVSPLLLKDSYPLANLQTGKSYFYAVRAENSSNLQSEEVLIEFYVPKKVSVDLKYNVMNISSCSDTASVLLCQKVPKTLLDTQVKQMQLKSYPKCNLINNGNNSYTIDCLGTQQCSSSVSLSSCNGITKNIASGSCKSPTVDTSYLADSCAVEWNPSVF